MKSIYFTIIVNYLGNPALSTDQTFFFTKVNQLNLECITKLKTFPCSPIKTWGKSVKRFTSYDRTYKQTEITTLSMPRLLKVTSAVYPHLSDFTGKRNFRNKIRPTQLRILKPSYEHSLGLPSSPIQIWGKSVLWFLIYYRTNKQTEITNLSIYI